MTWLVPRLLHGCDSAELVSQSLQVALPLISLHSPSVYLFGAGFFSPVPGSLLTQVGRGYTDLAAALLAAGLGATELQIWKEVDGIFTADPRKVLTARLLPVISPEEAAELTYYGSEVVHPFTMEQARTEPFFPLHNCAKRATPF
jgi:aspartate kinase